MREIKFRAWDGTRMIAGNYYLSFTGKSIAQISEPMAVDMKYFGSTDKLNYKDISKYRLMQYTGLKDKHGKEIYESDLVVVPEYPFYSNGLRNYIGEIFWDDTNYQWAYDLHVVSDRVRGVACGGGLYDIVGLEIEIIGNIYESPELLEVS